VILSSNLDTYVLDNWYQELSCRDAGLDYDFIIEGETEDIFRNGGASSVE
jgi:hypothetical protein